MKESIEQIENMAYKKFVDQMLKKNQGDFCPMRKEQQMDHLFAMLAHDFKQKGQRVLDACCGYGRLIHFLNEFDSQQNYFGVDYVHALIEQGRANFAGQNNIRFETGDVMKLADFYDKEFDIAINYKTLYCLPYYETLVEQLVKVTKNRIYITSPFYDGDYEFIAKIHNTGQSDANAYSYLNTYSFPKFERFCQSLGVKEVNAVDMKLDFDLPKPTDPNILQTYTIPITEQERLEITGVVILNWKLVQLVL